MSNRVLFADERLINQFVKNLTEVESDGWTTKYLNTSSNEYWLRYVTEIHRGGASWRIHLMKLSPRPTTNQLIDISMESTFKDEVVAAATRLFLDEQDHAFEFRSELIDRLT